MFKRLKRKQLYKDKWLSLFLDEIKFPDGSLGTYAWVSRKNGVEIVVVTTDNKILLSREYRYVTNSYSWEIPGGGIDEGETPEQAAARELFEETGIKAIKFEALGVFYPLQSFNTESLTFFYTLVKPSQLTRINSESSELADDQKFVSFSEALNMIDNGEVTSDWTANAIQIAIRKLEKK